jgi:hypothetical protein
VVCVPGGHVLAAGGEGDGCRDDDEGHRETDREDAGSLWPTRREVTLAAGHGACREDVDTGKAQ